MTDGGKFKKYMSDNKITYEQFLDPAFRRSEQVKVKSEAVWVAFHELGGLINISKFARAYLHRSQSWFMQKLNGLNVCGRKREFTAEEYAAIAAALRAVAERLNVYADEIDRADEA